MFFRKKNYVLYIINKLQDPIMFFRIKILCFIYYLQVAGSHHVFQNINIMFYILPTSCRIPSCFSEYKYYVLYITYKLQDPIMFFRIKILCFIYYLQVAGSHHVFQKKKLCFIYYQQVAGSHHVFQNKNIMFYILPTNCRIPSCFSE